MVGSFVWLGNSCFIINDTCRVKYMESNAEVVRECLCV